MPVNRALKAAQVPCDLFAALEAKHEAPPPTRRCICISAACAAFRAYHQLQQLLLLRFYCGLHELSAISSRK
jgi:hypothetical protein